MSIEYPCVHWNDGKCKKFSNDKVTSWCVKSPCDDQAPSNADRIRAMSDEELAEVFSANCTYRDFCYGCVAEKDMPSCPGESTGKWTEWLKQPAEVTDNANECVCCGKIIPEGRQVCLACEAKVDLQKITPNTKEALHKIGQQAHGEQYE